MKTWHFALLVFLVYVVYACQASFMASYPASQITGVIPMSAMPVFTVTQTNFVNGQLYTNNTGNLIAVSATFTMTTAAILGKSESQLRINGVVTNVITIPTVLLGLAGNYQNGLCGYIPNGSVYCFTNTSTGIGNNVGTFIGQILIY